MQFKQFRLPTIAVALMAASLPIFSQVVPTGQSGSEKNISVGAGLSDFDMDWGHSRMLGVTVWSDWHPGRIPRLFNGLGVEAEVRDISLDRGSDKPSNFRQDTFGGGPIYTVGHFGRFRPYVKALASFGVIDFQLIHAPLYTQETRTVYAAGGGFDYRLNRRFWARADYEYQAWPDFLNQTLDPQGFTVGVAYAFGEGARR